MTCADPAAGQPSDRLESEITGHDDELTPLLAEVAQAAGLQEGEAGVRQVLRAIQELAPASTRSVSRQTGLPVPVVAAVSNELRGRGLVTRQRPSGLTERGQALLGGAPHGLAGAATCRDCDGLGVSAARFGGLTGQLAELAAAAPRADPALDQSHCTAETKLRRVLLLLRYGLLPGRSLLVAGDDDLMAVTVAMTGAALGHPLVERLAVVEVSPQILEFTGERLASLGVAAELIQHDLRGPLPAGLTGGFDLAMTDTPYTPEGARLFLSRATEGLRPGPGQAIVFSFGPKGPADTLRIQETLLELGLAVQALHRGFNEYEGAGVIGGRSHLYWLATTERTGPVVTGDYTGPVYTADARGAARRYLCLGCGARHVVGPRADWRTIAELSVAGCPQCGGHRLRPLQLAPAPGSGAGTPG